MSARGIPSYRLAGLRRRALARAVAVEVAEMIGPQDEAQELSPYRTLDDGPISVRTMPPPGTPEWDESRRIDLEENARQRRGGPRALDREGG